MISRARRLVRDRLLPGAAILGAVLLLERCQVATGSSSGSGLSFKLEEERGMIWPGSM